MRLTPTQRQRIRTARAAAGLTQQALAEQAGYTTYRPVTAAERGDDVSEAAIESICRVLGLTFEPSKPAEIGNTKES